MIEVGRRITELREERNLTTNRLANLCGISQSFLRDIELGKKQPTVEYLSYICYGLNITLYDFFRDNNEDELSRELSRLSEEQKKSIIELIKAFKQ